MSELLATFKRRADALVAAINRSGGISATIAGLRRQMAVADRRRATSKVKTELARLDGQITEMITAVGIQAVGLHKNGKLASPELVPLCDHIIQLEDAVAQQKAELAQLEAARHTESAQAGSAAERICTSCARQVPPHATFCPYCGAVAPEPETERFCVHCGAQLRERARFCARCGQTV